MRQQLKYLLKSLFVKVNSADGMREFVLGCYLYNASSSGRLCSWCLKKALSLEGGHFYSITARKIMLERYGVSIGAYSYGACFEPGIFGPGTTVGRYVSISPRVRVIQANHPIDRLSTHAFFFNSELGYVPETNVPFTYLKVEHDSWIGESVIITPGCKRIGFGAIVGAGSIVTKDVPDFAVVGGNPAQILKYRFSDLFQEKVKRSRWWELPISECVGHIDFLKAPLQSENIHYGRIPKK
jgi:virginiamycin A acetyltransferase